MQKNKRIMILLFMVLMSAVIISGSGFSEITDAPDIRISKLDFDFRDYANTYFTRTENGMNGEKWQHWLKDVN